MIELAKFVVHEAHEPLLRTNLSAHSELIAIGPEILGQTPFAVNKQPRAEPKSARRLLLSYR